MAKKTTAKTVVIEAAAKTGTGLSVKGQYTQDNIPAMLADVNEKIKAITKGSAEKPKTDGKELPGFGLIKKQKDLGTLIKMSSSVTGRENAYNAEVEAIGFEKAPKFTLEGCTASQWKADIQARYQEVLHSTRLEKLKRTKAILEENLSQEAKLANDLAKIAEDLADY